VRNDSCFSIDQIDVSNITGSSFYFNVVVSLDNPGTSAWLRIGSVESTVIEVDAVDDKQVSFVWNEKHFVMCSAFRLLFVALRSCSFLFFLMHVSCVTSQQ
jgi:hypothetical protein